MRKFTVRRSHLGFAAFLVACCVLLQQSASASPFGQGVFGANIPFGAATSLSIALSGDVSLGLTPSGGNFIGSGSNTVTVTSTDTIGYRLYAYSPLSTTMVRIGGGDSISASGNSTPAALAVNSWGYNTTGSTTNFIGMLTTPSLIKDATGPYKLGDITTVTYGAKTDVTKSAGSYSVGVIYTAAAKNP